MDRLNDSLEQAVYLDFQGDRIFTTLHGTPHPAARVLLVGPFASERFFSWTPWVRWGRFLAARGIEALRFDYRGVGESTGRFEEMAFEEWLEDLEFLAGFLRGRSPDLPLILHGLEMGAVLASMAFARGVADVLLLWSPPGSGNQVLRRPLSRHAFKNMFAGKSVADYIRELETGGSLEVEGYRWPERLWRQSFAFQSFGGQTASQTGTRPVKSQSLDGTSAALLKGSAIGSILSLNLDLSGLYTENFDWMMAALPSGRRAQ